MADRRSRRRKAPKRALIAPLVMLAGGVATGVVVWEILMLDGPRPGLQLGGDAGHERLSHHDRLALDRLLDEHRAR